MHLHVLGICGTFMGGLAAIARSAGHTVTGCDANVYPPMSTQLRALGIALTEGYDAAQLKDAAAGADIFVVGNAISRGNPLLEVILDTARPYTSGPQWLAENVLREKWVLAVAGTHGKTTTTAMLAWILERARLDPGFLIGGVPVDFGVSARLTDAPFFVIEADEYDTAFCDKRSKFVHYRPRTAVLNNLEYDHADIFPDLAAIETQFHHLVRTIPKSGRIVSNGDDANLERVLARGCWSEVERFGAGGAGSRAGWTVSEDGSIVHAGAAAGSLSAFTLIGAHNRMNALAAVVASRHVSVPVHESLAALATFRGVKRRMEVRGTVSGITVYDDFAHHPTAIAATVGALRRSNGKGRILAVLEPRSNTMKLGTMKAALAPSLADADLVFCYAPPNLGWNPAEALAPLGDRARTEDDLPRLIEAIVEAARSGDRVLVMSNGGFGGIHERLLARLGANEGAAL